MKGEKSDVKKQLIVGLTGPSGAGKSTVAARFAERGFFVVDADAVARRAAAADSPALPMLCAAFGADVVRADGSLDRRLLADRAFATKEGTQQLNSIMHPIISRMISEAVEKSGASHVLLDAPQLFESGEDKRCDCTVAVLADRDRRKERMMARDSLTDEQAERRMSAQLPDAFFEEKCDFLIYNNSDIAALVSAGDRVIDMLRSKPE